MQAKMPMQSIAEREELVAFDAVRGIAAIAVCASHVRAFLLVDFSAIPSPSLTDRVLYFATGLGHQAVIVFFVMSGWLVGGSVWRQNLSGRFFWTDYAIARLSRLWVVLIPALLWTLCIDVLGMRASGGWGYDGGQASAIHSGPAGSMPVDLSAIAMLGNAVFLQTVLVPVFGTNSPLWSLANEFWYYVLFPLMALAWHRRSNAALAFGTISLATLIVLPSDIGAGFFIWLGGAVASRLPARGGWTFMIGAGCALIGTLFAAKSGSALGSDFAVGLAVSALLVGLAGIPKKGMPVVWIRASARYLARISYTLYLFHFPLLAFIFFSLRLTQQQPTARSLAEFAALLIGVLLVSTGLWFMFERNTEMVRNAVRRTIARRKDAAIWKSHEG
jgi:peptidoglycan/LPS O-acetylase OafA/YrhL